jgi:hypothetical protein
MAEGRVRCGVCEHPSVLGINQAILNGKSYRAIARDFKVGSERSGTFKPNHAKVRLHAEKCMSTSYQQIQETNLTTQGKAIQARLDFLDQQVDTVIADALKGHLVMVGDAPLLNDDGSEKRERSVSELRALLAAVREGRHNAEVKAKLAGAMPEQDQGALERSRLGLEDPAVRKLVQQMEELLAKKETEAGRDQVT